MADPLVAPDVVRYTVHQVMGGRPIATVLDQVVLDTVGIKTRHEAIDDVAGDIIDAWDQYVLGGQSTSLSATHVSWIDLTSTEGETGSKSSTTDTTWPANGRAEGDALPSSVAVLVTKETSSGRGTRNGRMYVAGLTEQFCNGNFITNAFLSTLVDDYGNFTEALTETGNIAQYETFPTVVHTKNTGTAANPVIEYVGNTQVTSFAPQQRVASQRRRNRP